MPQKVYLDEQGNPIQQAGTRGPLVPGNIDLFAQPKVPNPNGGTSTVYSFSANIDGREVLLPMVTPDGRLLDENAAIEEYRKTGKHLGVFDSPESATAYAEQLHNDYAAGKYQRASAKVYLDDQGNEIDDRGNPVFKSSTTDADNAAVAQLFGVRPGALGISDPLFEGVLQVGKSAARSGYNLLQGATNYLSGADLPDAPASLQPDTPGEYVGDFAEQGLEFLLPAKPVAGLVGKAAEYGPRLKQAARIVGEAAGAYGISSLQGGDAGTTALIAGAVPVVGQGISATGRAIGRQAPKLVRSALKPTVTAMKQQAGASRTGIDAQAERLVQFVLDNEITSAAKAQQIIDDAEREIGRLVDNASGVATDAPQRAQRYLQALERSAQRQGLPADDVASIRAKMAELLDESPLSEDVVTTVMAPSPSGLVGPSGQPVLVPVDETSRALRTDVDAKEALDLARGGGKWGNRKAWGEQKGATREASKAVERAERDAVKTAVPDTRPVLQREGQAIQAKNVFERMQFREGNREPISPFDVMTAAVETSQGRPPIMAVARHFLWNNKIKLGIWAKRLEQAIERNDVQEAGEILGRFGVGTTGQMLPAPSGATR